MRAALAGVLTVALQALPQAQSELAFEELAQHWTQEQGLDPARAQELGWRGLLEQHFAHLPVGLFDVYVPVDALQDAGALRDVGAAVLALLETQAGWSSWSSGEEVGARKEDAATKWIRSWSPRTLGSAPAAGSDLIADLAPKDALEIFTRLRALLENGAGLGTPAIEPARLVLFPQRAGFVEFTSVSGWTDPILRPSAWSDSVTTWLEYDADGTHFVALQYGYLSTDKHYDQGLGVAARNPRALSELVSQVAARALLKQVFGGRLDPALASGLANTLVIDLYGELDTRIDGDVRSRSSQGRSVFVPGGNPNGGFLPPTSAENRWRGTKGKDHFVGILSQVQKLSGKRGKAKAEKLGRFTLLTDAGAAGEVVSAPFLGPGGAPPSAAVWPDYLELVRCYGVAFLHWLHSEGGGRPRESAERYARLLQGLAQAGEDQSLPAIFESVYGLPLSATATEALFDDGQTLEGRFLLWLGKQR